MKKLILSLLIFCSAFATAQISIPQVTGLPAALNSKVDKVTGKSLVADTSVVKLTGIQAGAQVNKIEGVQKNGIDLTITGKKVNITVPTTAAEIGAQPAGTYATGTGTAYNSNNGDETTASIKTKLGAASWVSEGYITYDDYLWFSSKEPGNANIQAHISSTSNPHSVTKNQVGLGNVDNTSDANKPVSTAMQTALNSKQASGTYSTDIHGNITALNAVSGTNTGDETLTSIKTKLGAASAVSDGYLRYQDFALLHTPTTVTASNGLSISGQNISLQNASLTQAGALTFNDYNKFNSKEPAITKNSGFNLPLGNTTGTVLEGRTFGTAANSAVGDFQPIENQRLSTANSPSFNKMTSTVATGTAPLTVNSTTMVGNLNAQYFSYKSLSDFQYNSDNYYAERNANTIIGGYGLNTTGSGTGNSNFPYGYGTVMTYDLGYGRTQLHFNHMGELTVRSKWGDRWNTNRIVWDSGNLTNNLSTNYLPKWNGSSMVNSLISDDGNLVYINNTKGIYISGDDPSNSYWLRLNNINGGNQYSLISGIVSETNQGFSLRNITANRTEYKINSNGDFIIPSSTQSTLPTTGALVVNGGMGADHVRANNFYGNGSNLTGIQLPITLTTNGTSGAATFSGNVLNVPNYSGSGGVDQTQTTVNGSTGGNMVCSMPFRAGSYKKVMIRFSSLSGNASYSYPTLFITQPSVSPIYQQVGASGTYTTGGAGASAFTITGASGLSGWVILEGY